MSNDNSVSENEGKLRLFDRILSKLSARNLLTGSAQYLSCFVAAATIYQITGGDTTSISIASPILGSLIDQIGSDVLANILGKVAEADENGLSEEDFRGILESELEKLNFKAPLTESEFYRAIRILSQRNEQQLISLATQISEVSHQLRLLHPSERAALSIFPRTSRPLMIETPIIGREVELEWLSNIKNDSLVIGQPGTGKTFLLYQLILNGTAAFLNTSDSIEIRNALKIDVPQILIVDDGLYMILLANLKLWAQVP